MPILRTPRDPQARAELLWWAQQRLRGVQFAPETAMPVAVIVSDTIAAVAVYHMRRGVNIEMSIASDTPRWASRMVIAELLALPFNVLSAHRITAIVRSDNTHSRQFVERLGFKYEGYMPDAFEDADAVVFGLTKIRWLASKWHRYHKQRRRLAQEAA